MKEVKGDLLTDTSQYIVHQVSATGLGAGGLGGIIVRTFPYADIYRKRTPQSVPKRGDTAHPEFPGNIIISGDGHTERYVINAVGQFALGPIHGDFDTRENRAKWFGECLEKIEQIDKLRSVAFPFQIGCGIAGGDWSQYKKVIAQFAQRVSKRGVEVTIIEPVGAAAAGFPKKTKG